MSDAANPEDTNTAKPADSPAASWLDRLPPGMRNYAVLGRYDRPIGIWLLFWPCALGSIAASIYAGDSWPNLWQIALLFIGAAVMRAAGCTYNDIVDRDIDAQVARTRGRPVAAGRISVKAAWGFLVAQSLVGFLVLIQFNGIAILVGLGALALVAAYPFMKRLTDWPQAWLGLTFNWGVLVAWTATTGALNIAALLLYGAGIAWTLGYDTIYAAQDVEDDALVGVRSTARLFGDAAGQWITRFYMVTGLCLIWGLWLSGAHFILAIGAAIPAISHLGHQVRRFDHSDGARALMLFKSNGMAGALMAGGAFAAFLFS